MGWNFSKLRSCTKFEKKRPKFNENCTFAPCQICSNTGPSIIAYEFDSNFGHTEDIDMQFEPLKSLRSALSNSRKN